jgi:hypothetical protein
VFQLLQKAKADKATVGEDIVTMGLFTRNVQVQSLQIWKRAK